jgi:UDP-glucose 4-epimerase
MRVLVTGGAGFIGSHIAKAAVEAGHQVAVLDDLSSGSRDNLPGAVEFFEVDVTQASAVETAVFDFRPEVVSHQAALVSIPLSMAQPRRDAEVNLLGTLGLLEVCCRAGVKRFVFASTGGAIYGEVSEGHAASENDPLYPKSPYGIHKLAAEQMLGVFERERGITTCALRYANVYGPGQAPRGEAGVVAIFMERALQGEPLCVNARERVGDGGCIRDYIFVEDVVRMNLFALEGRVDQPVVNVGTGIATNTLHLAQKVLEVLGREGRIEQSSPRAGDIGRSVLDAGRARRWVGSFTHLDAGLARTAQWFLSRARAE